MADKYKELLVTMRAKAENKFNAVFVVGIKNIVLLRLNKPMNKRAEFMTIAVNFHDQSFHHGHYDMDFFTATENFKQRVEESNWNPKFDLPNV